MEVARIPGVLTYQAICSPYSTLQHLRRTFKFLAQLKRGGGNILVVGQRHKHACTFLSSHFPGLSRLRGSPASAASSLSAASAHYSLIVCLDCVAFAPLLRNINLPVLGICTPRELHEHPEIIRVLDYIIPHNGTRSDVALQKLLEEEVLDTPPQLQPPAERPRSPAFSRDSHGASFSAPPLARPLPTSPPLGLGSQRPPPLGAARVLQQQRRGFGVLSFALLQRLTTGPPFLRWRSPPVFAG